MLVDDRDFRKSILYFHFDATIFCVCSAIEYLEKKNVRWVKYDVEEEEGWITFRTTNERENLANETRIVFGDDFNIIIEYEMVYDETHSLLWSKDEEILVEAEIS